MPDFEVLITGPVMPLIREGLEARFTVHKLHEMPDKEAFIAAHGARIRALVGGAGHGRIDSAFMRRFPNLRIVGNFGVGYDGIDAAWAGQNGIVVTNTPDVLTDEVADLAMGLLIATIRRLPQADAYVRAGRWLDGAFPLTGSLREKSMGILGLGRIGSAIAARAQAFGLELAYHSRTPKPDVSFRYYASLVEMARDVDILMVIAPGGEATRRIVSRAVMEALGPAGMLINVARGTLVDEPAMVELLRSGKLGAAGLDVFEDEPRVPEALFGLENVVLLPHVGSASHYTRNKMGQLVVDNIASFAEGRGPLTPVPETPWPPIG
ncbi:MAG: 2-hydroxyacid dehydrogenase [Hyphomicrobiales bacterium]|nr:2-hydroxyacid dehydrogenase [Hyphomicrobiales bacterium]MCA1998375.1 2-hydroxyacid dehydrogenase [Hyphomicrobiales bacterium]